MKEMVNLEVSGVVMDPRSSLPVVILKDEEATWPYKMERHLNELWSRGGLHYGPAID